MSLDKKHICCPACGKKDTFRPDNPSRPFCSPRCKLIDLGQWASEEHRISGPPASPEDMLSNDKTKDNE